MRASFLCLHHDMGHMEEEKEQEMVAETAEGSHQLLAQGKGQILNYIPWMGLPLAGWTPGLPGLLQDLGSRSGRGGVKDGGKNRL